MSSITIICHNPKCQKGRYEIRSCKTEHANSQAIDWAVCPFCQTPRNPKLWATVERRKLCTECHRPIKDLKKARFRKCEMCYMREYRKHKKDLELQKLPLLYTPNNETN